VTCRRGVVVREGALRRPRRVLRTRNRHAHVLLLRAAGIPTRLLPVQGKFARRFRRLCLLILPAWLAHSIDWSLGAACNAHHVLTSSSFGPFGGIPDGKKTQRLGRPRLAPGFPRFLVPAPRRKPDPRNYCACSAVAAQGAAFPNPIAPGSWATIPLLIIWPEMACGGRKCPFSWRAVRRRGFAPGGRRSAKVHHTAVRLLTSATRDPRSWWFIHSSLFDVTRREMPNAVLAGRKLFPVFPPVRRCNLCRILGLLPPVSLAPSRSHQRGPGAFHH